MSTTNETSPPSASVTPPPALISGSAKTPPPIGPKTGSPVKLVDVPPAQVSLKNNISELFDKAEAKKSETLEPAKATTGAAPIEVKKAEIPEKKIEAPDAKTAHSEVDAFAEIAPPAGLEGKKLDEWKTLKQKANTEVSEARQKLASAMAELDTLKKATPAELADVEAIKKEHREAMDRLAVLDLQNHPDFAKQYTVPKNAALAEATTILAYQDKPVAADLNQLLVKPLKEFNAEVGALTKEMNAMDATTVQSALRAAYKLHADERTALSKASDLKAGIEQRTAAQQKQAFEETWGKLGEPDRFLTPVAIADTLPAEERAELASYNEAMKAVRQNAESNAFGRLDPKGAAAIASKAAVLDFVVKTAVPRMEKEFRRVVEDNNTLIAELKAIKAAKGSGDFQSTPSDAPAAPKTIKEMINDLGFGKK